jgi:hypothetical protein
MTFFTRFFKKDNQKKENQIPLFSGQYYLIISKMALLLTQPHKFRKARLQKMTQGASAILVRPFT